MTKKVFLVDDDIDLIEQNKMVLAENGYEVITSSTAEEALELLKTVKPDILILDVMMEHHTAGFVLAREIGKKHNNIPIIILSGDPQKANWLGESNDTWDKIVKFLDKPVKPDELANVVKKVLGDE
ncbi:MAG: response regulator [Cyanobacteriota bacterium]